MTGLVAVFLLLLWSTSAAFAEAGATATVSSTDYLPNITLIDQANHPVALASLKGKPALVGFIHTSCEGPCELMTAKMRVIAQHLEPSFSSKVTMVSITTDPQEDHPKELANYAKTQGAQGVGWVYLTGDLDSVTRVLKIYGVPAGDPADMTTHVFELWLIGPDGRELHHYEGNGEQIKAAVVASDIKSANARMTQ